MKRPLPNLLVQGFQIALRNWPFVVWAYAVNLVFGLLAGIPFANGLAAYLDHSLAAEKIAGTIDITYLGELAMHLRETSLFPIAVHTAGWLNLLQVIVLFVLFAGTIFVYVSAEPPQLSVLLRGGVAYFWRFVRAAIMVGCVAAFILGILLTARAALLVKVSAVYVERSLFYYSAISGIVVLIVALLLRLWFDLVEVYIVRNAMDGERRVRQSLMPALRLLFRYFFRTVGSFLLAGMLGVSVLVLCLYIWKDFVPAHQVWIAFFLAQLGLFSLLASRFWQRGLEATLVLAADPPMVAAEEIAAMDEEEMPVTTGVGAGAGLSEPTLRELVMKLGAEPWGAPEAPPKTPPPTAPSIEVPPAADQPAASEPQSSLLDRHEKKFPLGGPILDPGIDAVDPVEEPTTAPDDPERPPRHGRPLP
jgi:hypothetical protein